MRYSKILSALFCVLGLFSHCYAGLGPLSLNQIASDIQSGKIPAQNFSITMQIELADHPMTNWFIGFYMPHTFNQFNHTGTSINPDLKIQLSNSILPNQGA